MKRSQLYPSQCRTTQAASLQMKWPKCTNQCQPVALSRAVSGSALTHTEKMQRQALSKPPREAMQNTRAKVNTPNHKGGRPDLTEQARSKRKTKSRRKTRRRFARLLGRPRSQRDLQARPRSPAEDPEAGAARAGREDPEPQLEATRVHGEAEKPSHGCAGHLGTVENECMVPATGCRKGTGPTDASLGQLSRSHASCCCAWRFGGEPLFAMLGSLC